MAPKEDAGRLRSFSFRAKIGEYEVELGGTREEVVKTIKELPSLMAEVHKAFEGLKPKTTTTLTIKTAPSAGTKEEAPLQKYPKIAETESGSEAISRLLATDWGKWRPRTIEELKEALEANSLSFAGNTLAGVLRGLVKKGRVRRWKTDAGFVYILAEEEVLTVKESEAK
jgi:hypothetical protein